MRVFNEVHIFLYPTSIGVALYLNLHVALLDTSYLDKQVFTI